MASRQKALGHKVGPARSEWVVLRSRSGRARLAIDLKTLRNLIQITLAALLLYDGWRFYLFVQQFTTPSAAPYVQRPGAVEAFLPLSALVATKNLVVNGVFDTIHPAGLVLFLAILAISLFLKKAVCGWLCPVGTLSEWLSRLGRQVFGRNFRLPRFVDLPLMSLKYLILAFFIDAILRQMPAAAIAAFIQSDYNRVADVKMLEFFTTLGIGGAIVLGTLMFLSVLVENFWCRYLCPYGALLGLASYLSVFQVVRDPALCIDCKLCTKACPNRIDVARAGDVTTPECNSCLNCVSACPRAGALKLEAAGRWALNPWVYPVLVVGTLVFAMALAKVTGHWDTSLTYADYAKLIPQATELTH